jgi:hypothetical protein
MIGEPETRNYKPLIGIAAAVVVVAAAVAYYLHSRHAPPATPPPAPPATAQQSEEPAIQHPLPSGSAANNAPLPALNESDASLKDALDPILGGSAVKDYLIPENIVRRLVVTIDNLPRQKVAVQKRPVNPVSGAFDVEGDEQHATLDARNFSRYRPLVGVIANVDVHQLVAVYQHYYPLFQQAYQDLGYPNGYFNDRLVQTIDSLLATPHPQGAIDLVRPNVMYVFADPGLEALPAGQKLLLRMGPENAAVIKAKLTELRAAVTALPPKK